MDDGDDECYVPTFHGRRVGATPATEAVRLLETLRCVYEHVFIDHPKDDFIKSQIEPLRRKPSINTDKYYKDYESACNLTTLKNGKPIKALHRGMAPFAVCFWAACASCVKAEIFAEDSPHTAWCYLMDGWYWYGLLTGRGSIKDAVWQSVEANEAKLKKDPKQAAKATVRECWDDWQKRPDRYDGKAAFARDMLAKFENLKSQPVIEGWCRKWERET